MRLGVEEKEGEIVLHAVTESLQLWSEEPKNFLYTNPKCTRGGMLRCLTIQSQQRQKRKQISAHGATVIYRTKLSLVIA